MASNSRTLTLALAADIDGLKKGLDDANKVVNKSADQIADFGKKAALAFAAVGAAATAFAVSAVKAAAQDEASRKKLEQTIRSNTKATEEQIAAIDTYITKQSIATATTDDVLRPALSRLIRSTQDVTKAQDLLNLAQNIAIGTGKPLETVVNALGKAYDGSNTALSKLGLGLDATTLKTKSFDEITQQLSGTWGGFVENEATNAEFKVKQLTIALEETKEQIGVALLPIVKQFADYLLAVVVPNVQALAAGLTGENSVTSGITDATRSAFIFGQQLRSTIDFIISIKEELLILGGIIATVFVANKVIAFVGAVQTLITAMVALRTAATAASVATAFATGGGSVAAGAVALAAAGIATGVASSAISGGKATSSTSSATAAQLAAGAARAGTTVNNITVQSIDPEGAARAVAKYVNGSAQRSVPSIFGNVIRGD
jgi:hypothetical protein